MFLISNTYMYILFVIKLSWKIILLKSNPHFSTKDFKISKLMSLKSNNNYLQELIDNVVQNS